MTTVTLDPHMAYFAMETAPDQSAIDRLLSDLAESSSDISDLVAQYRAGKITLAQLITQAHGLTSDQADDELDGMKPGTRASALMLKVGGTLATLAGLAVSGRTADALTVRQSDRLLATLGQSAVETAIGAAAAGHGTKPKAATTKAAAKSLDERTQAIIDKLNAGTISGPQAAAQIQSAVGNANWTAYQQEIRDLADTAGHTTATWELDPSAQHCDSCLDMADGSPYALDDLDILPGDPSLDCSVGCKCDVTYSGGDADFSADTAARFEVTLCRI